MSYLSLIGGKTVDDITKGIVRRILTLDLAASSAGQAKAKIRHGFGIYKQMQLLLVILLYLFRLLKGTHFLCLTEGVRTNQNASRARESDINQIIADLFRFAPHKKTVKNKPSRTDALLKCLLSRRNEQGEEIFKQLSTVLLVLLVIQV